MASAGGGYSRFVATAKIILPLAALALFATLFLIAKKIDPNAAVLERPEIEDIANDARIGTPEFSGVTSDGTIVALSAELARPDQDTPGRIMAEGVEAFFEIPDGSHVKVHSNAASVDGAARRMELSGSVEISTSTGYRIKSQEIEAELGQTEITSDGPVVAEGPPGRIEAGSLLVQQSESDPSAYILVFNDGVRLVYQP